MSQYSAKYQSQVSKAQSEAFKLLVLGIGPKHSHIWEAGTSECSAFLLDKWLNNQSIIIRRYKFVPFNISGCIMLLCSVANLWAEIQNFYMILTSQWWLTRFVRHSVRWINQKQTSSSLVVLQFTVHSADFQQTLLYIDITKWYKITYTMMERFFNIPQTQIYYQIFHQILLSD